MKFDPPPMPDPREQRVLPESQLADTPEEQARRMQAVETLGYLVNHWGLDIVARWVNDHDQHVLPMIEDFGVDRVTRWLSYFKYQQGLRERK